MQAGESPDPRAHWAIAYFRSGWAFLVPYTLIYFAYAWLKWRVNPLGAGGKEQGAGSFGVPLLYLYWALHAIHVALGAVALVAWWRKEKGTGSKETAGPHSASSLRSPASRALMSALPWIGLALLFWIPGVYLEFPADPWQHLARTNEWAWLAQVKEHSYWAKSSYFLAYSLVRWAGIPVAQLCWFDLYYAGCCLLLCWQYYRLARAIGLSERAALLFVLINALTFGNNLFGFYRYYGMSSTVFAQMGAVAMVRVALVALGGGEQGEGSKDISGARARLPERLSLLRPLASLVLLAGVTFGNHKQGILIAGAGLAAVVCWRLAAWRRSMIGWLALGAVLASGATVLWWPQHPLINSSFRPGGWLTSWYGFNLFQPSSPGFQRAWVMIGAIGAINLAAGLWLFRRNPVVAWLTWMPLVLLTLPCFALPFANILAASTDVDGGYIIAFHRILLAIPAGLALVTFCAQYPRRKTPAASEDRKIDDRNPGVPPLTFPRPPAVVGGILLLSGLLVVLPSSAPGFNRNYNILMKPAADTTMMKVVRSLERPRILGSSPAPRFISTGGITYLGEAISDARVYRPRKHLVSSPLDIMHASVPDFGGAVARREVMIAFYPFPKDQFTPESLIGRLSGHWNPHQVSLEFVFGDEMAQRLIQVGGREVSDDEGRLFLSPAAARETFRTK